MRIIDLQYLQKIAHHTSITAAAEELNISQQRLSHIIQTIEDEIGISIFHRSKKGIELSTDGTEFMKHVQQLLNVYETMQTIKEHPVTQPHITIGIDRHITSNMLDAILAVLATYPEFEFSVQQKNSVFEIIDALENGSIQLAFSVSAHHSAEDYLATKQQNSTIKSYTLGTSTMDILLHKDNPCLTKPNLQLEDVLLYPMVFDTMDSTYRHLLRSYKHINIFLESDSTELKLSCINHNFAVGLMDAVTLSHIDFAQQYPNIRRIKLSDFAHIDIKLLFFENESNTSPEIAKLSRQVRQSVAEHC